MILNVNFFLLTNNFCLSSLFSLFIDKDYYNKLAPAEPLSETNLMEQYKKARAATKTFIEPLSQKPLKETNDIFVEKKRDGFTISNSRINNNNIDLEKGYQISVSKVFDSKVRKEKENDNIPTSMIASVRTIDDQSAAMITGNNYINNRLVISDLRARSKKPSSKVKSKSRTLSKRKKYLPSSSSIPRSSSASKSSKTKPASASKSSKLKLTSGSGSSSSNSSSSRPTSASISSSKKKRKIFGKLEKSKAKAAAALEIRCLKPGDGSSFSSYNIITKNIPVGTDINIKKKNNNKNGPMGSILFSNPYIIQSNYNNSNSGSIVTTGSESGAGDRPFPSNKISLIIPSTLQSKSSSSSKDKSSSRKIIRPDKKKSLSSPANYANKIDNDNCKINKKKKSAKSISSNSSQKSDILIASSDGRWNSVMRPISSKTSSPSSLSLEGLLKKQNTEIDIREHVEDFGSLILDPKQQQEKRIKEEINKKKKIEVINVDDHHHDYDNKKDKEKKIINNNNKKRRQDPEEYV